MQVLVWEVSTQRVLARLHGFHQNAVGCLQFSPTGDKLATVGRDVFNTLAIYDWRHQDLLCATQTGSDPVLDIAWRTDTELLVINGPSAQFCKIQGTNILTQTGVMGAVKGRSRAHTSCAYVFKGSLCLTGNETGDVLQWDGFRLKKVYKAHNGAVQAIVGIKGGSEVLTGGSDCKVIAWDETLSQLNAIDLNRSTKMRPEICSLDYNEDLKLYLVGTKGGEALELVTPEGGKHGKDVVLVRGHFATSIGSELWGAACHPKE